MSDPRARPRRSSRRAAPDPARAAAYDVLAAVRNQDSYTNLVLPPLLRARGLTGRDAAFVTELVSGTVRRQGTYDAVIGACVSRPLTQVDAPVLDALRLGTHQVLAMRVPSHTTVGTTVDLVRARVRHGPSGFVNAVLRKVAAHDLSGWVRRVAPDPVSGPAGWPNRRRWTSAGSALRARGRLWSGFRASSAACPTVGARCRTGARPR